MRAGELIETGPVPSGAGAGGVLGLLWRPWSRNRVGILFLLPSDDMCLIPVGVYSSISAFGVEWGKLMAAVGVALLPAIVLFIILQRSFIQGLTSGATKG